MFFDQLVIYHNNCKEIHPYSTMFLSVKQLSDFHPQKKKKKKKKKIATPDDSRLG